jgi:ADP-heptose:LPS heptosyltransferase
MTKLILHSNQSIGDVVAITAIPRDLARRYPGEFQIGVSTSHEELWFNNPGVALFPQLNAGLITKLQSEGWRIITMRNPRVNESNRLPQHYLSSWSQYLGQVLGKPFEVTEFKGDIYMAENEMAEYPVLGPGGEQIPYWIIVSGGKVDYSVHWPVHQFMQDVTWRFRDTFGDKVKVVQIGAAGDMHLELRGAIDLRGKTTLRQLVQLVWHSQGCICPNTMLAHLAAAVPIKRPEFNLPKDHPHQDKCHNLRQGQPLRPCVVIGGASMPATWSAYPGHAFLQNIGTMDCCSSGACWRSRAQKIGDGNEKDNFHLCLHPVEMGAITYGKCMTLIKPEEIWSAVWKYYQGGALEIPK